MNGIKSKTAIASSQLRDSRSFSLLAYRRCALDALRVGMAMLVFACWGASYLYFDRLFIYCGRRGFGMDSTTGHIAIIDRVYDSRRVSVSSLRFWTSHYWDTGGCRHDGLCRYLIARYGSGYIYGGLGFWLLNYPYLYGGLAEEVVGRETVVCVPYWSLALLASAFAAKPAARVWRLCLHSGARGFEVLPGGMVEAVVAQRTVGQDLTITLPENSDAGDDNKK